MRSNYFTYDKKKVIQALRYHFITRREIKLMIILVNLFAILSAILFYMHKIQSLHFFLFSVMWFVMMIVFWFLLPNLIYRKSATFKDRLRVDLLNEDFRIENEKGGQSWPYTKFSTWMESPHFFHMYFNPRSFFIVPKDAFEGDDVHEARKILVAHIPK
jgi:YcxB-like protein